MRAKDRTRNEISGGIFFSAVIQGRDITVMLPPQLHAALAGLPDESKVFTGRDVDLLRLMELLDPASPEATSVRVSAVAGLAGVGKTELVLQAAHLALRNGWFPGGVLFVDMFGYDPQRKIEASAALEGMLRAAGIPGEHIPAEAQDRSRLFSSLIAAYAEEDKPVLVVVDNVSSSAHVRPLLPAGGKAVVTSRHTLADLEARLLELDVLTPQAGVDLLAGQLRLARGAVDTRVADHPDDALSIARLCAGLPLALRIIAALLAAHPAQPLPSMTADLQDARTRLDEISYPDAGGEVAVRSAFDLSYRQLDPHQARTFRLLTLNPGPEISTEAASAMTAVDQRTIRRQLNELARAHLIEPGSTDGRWRMHDLIRLYAAQQIQAQAGDWGEPLAELLLYYLRTAQAARRHLNPTITHPAGDRFPDRTVALAWLDAEYPNLTAVARFYPPSDVVADLSLDLWRYFEFRRHFDDWITLTTRALAIARQLQDRQREGTALISLGGALRHVRRFDEAIAACQDAAAIRRETGDRHGEGIALNNLAAAQVEAGRFEEAITTSQDAIAIFRETSDRYREGVALTNLGAGQLEGKRFEDAIVTYREAAGIFREVGDRGGEAGVLTNLANALSEVERLDEAIAASRDAVAIFHETGDRHAEGIALINLGGAQMWGKRFEDAIITNQAAAVVLRNTGDRHGEGGALINLGDALRQAGRFGEAAAALREAAAAYRESGDRKEQAEATNKLGDTLRRADQHDDAIVAHQAAIAIFHETGNRRGEGRALYDLGGAQMRAKRFEQAITAFRDAAQLFRDTGDRHSEGKALSLLGSVLGQGRLEEANAALQEAAQLFRETGDQSRESRTLKHIETLEGSKRQWDAYFALLDAGQFENVIIDLQKVAILLHRTGDRYGEGVALTGLGIALKGVKRFEEAITALQDAAHIFRDTGDRDRNRVAQTNLDEARKAQLAGA